MGSGASGQTQRWTAPAPRRVREGSRALPHAAVPRRRAAGRPRRTGAEAVRAVQAAGFPRSHSRRSPEPPRTGLRAAPLCSVPNKGAALALPSGTAEFYIPRSARGDSAARFEPRPGGRPGTPCPERGCLRRGRAGQSPALGVEGGDPPATCRLCPVLPGLPRLSPPHKFRSPRGTPKETAPSRLSGRAGNGSALHRREPGSSNRLPGGAASLPQHPRHEYAWEGIPAPASPRSLDGAARPAAPAPPGPAPPPLAGFRLPPAGRSGERRAEPAAGPPLGWGGGSGVELSPGGRVWGSRCLGCRCEGAGLRV